MTASCGPAPSPSPREIRAIPVPTRGEGSSPLLLKTRPCMAARVEGLSQSPHPLCPAHPWECWGLTLPLTVSSKALPWSSHLLSLYVIFPVALEGLSSDTLQTLQSTCPTPGHCLPNRPPHFAVDGLASFPDIHPWSFSASTPHHLSTSSDRPALCLYWQAPQHQLSWIQVSLTPKHVSLGS